MWRWLRSGWFSTSSSPSWRCFFIPTWIPSGAVLKILLCGWMKNLLNIIFNYEWWGKRGFPCIWWWWLADRVDEGAKNKQGEGDIKEKLVVAVFGYEINLVSFNKKGLDWKLIIFKKSVWNIFRSEIRVGGRWEGDQGAGWRWFRFFESKIEIFTYNFKKLEKTIWKKSSPLTVRWFAFWSAS